MKTLIITTILFLFACSKESNQSSSNEITRAHDIRISGKLIKLFDKTELRKKRKKIRLYPGAPPVIPHPLEKPFEDYNSCLNCHKVGDMHGPNVLHANQINCTQCHVRIKSKTLFKENLFLANDVVTITKRPNPIGPPYIPHRIQDRKNCHICHIDDGAPKELIPRHGNLMNCLQCHVQLQKIKGEFQR